MPGCSHARVERREGPGVSHTSAVEVELWSLNGRRTAGGGVCEAKVAMSDVVSARLAKLPIMIWSDAAVSEA